ncbi:response regulator transcription factor [Pseudogracilibacillus sp. SE30717A]|uniref:response regulator transcription factor n=1 Tax=Pseudogracilibacillus sp. SE30717A TaxID=3098293 RepID=UPI00300DDAAD
MQKKKINLAILESDQLSREGIKLILEGQKLFNVVTINDCFDAKILTSKPIDILLIELNIFKENQENIRGIVEESSPQMKIVVLANTKEKNYVVELVRFGVHGYLLKRISPATFVDAIKTIHRGKYYICPLLTYELVEDYRKLKRATEGLAVNYGETKNKKPEFLTDREYEVLTFISKGRSNLQISKALKISEKTVKKHLGGLFKKMGVKSRTEAVVQAIQKGWISDPALQKQRLE